MAEEPELGIRRTPSGMHALGKVEYEIKDGEVVYKKGGTVGVMLTESEAKLPDFEHGTEVSPEVKLAMEENGRQNRRRVPPSTEVLVRLFGPGSMTAAQKCEGSQALPSIRLSFSNAAGTFILPFH